MSAPGRSPGLRPAVALVALANARRPRRDRYSRQGHREDPLASIEGARRLLEPLGLSTQVDEGDLSSLSALAEEVSAIASALAAGRPAPEPTTINELTGQAVGRPRLAPGGDGVLRSTIAWAYPSAPVELAHRLIDELGALHPDRLRECEGAECSLIFYDATRPGTQRWHAEDPCGWFERQRRHRSGRP